MPDRASLDLGQSMSVLTDLRDATYRLLRATMDTKPDGHAEAWAAADAADKLLNDEDQAMRLTAPVIRALRDLHTRHSRWPTVEDIAKYLKADEKDVKAALGELKAKRIVDVRTRQKRRVWMPWGES